MVMILTFFVILSLKNFRKEIQALYFIYFNETSQKTGLKLLGKRTVVIRNVENLDMAGYQLRAIVDRILVNNNDDGKMFGCIFLPDYTRIYKLEARNRRLEFFNELYRSKKMGKVPNLLLPKEVKLAACYVRKRRQLAQEIRNGLDTCENSGYAFACFSSFESISILEKCASQYLN